MERSQIKEPDGLLTATDDQRAKARNHLILMSSFVYVFILGNASIDNTISTPFLSFTFHNKENLIVFFTALFIYFVARYTLAYLCGYDPLVKEYKATLASLSFVSKRIHQFHKSSLHQDRTKPEPYAVEDIFVKTLADINEIIEAYKSENNVGENIKFGTSEKEKQLIFYNLRDHEYFTCTFTSFEFFILHIQTLFKLISGSWLFFEFVFPILICAYPLYWLISGFLIFLTNLSPTCAPYYFRIH